MTWSELPKDKRGRTIRTRTQFKRKPSPEVVASLSNPHVKEARVPVIDDLRSFNRGGDGEITGRKFFPR